MLREMVEELWVAIPDLLNHLKHRRGDSVHRLHLWDAVSAQDVAFVEATHASPLQRISKGLTTERNMYNNYMKRTPSNPQRRNLRVPEFDYSQPGAYFVTIVTRDRKTLFGQIVDGETVLNDIGKMVEEVWIAIPKHFSNVELGEFVIMLNHIHGIISITVEATHGTKSGAPIGTLVGATHASPLPRISKGPMPGSIGAIIGSFTSAASKRFRDIPNNAEIHLWQRNYYERFIRNERDYQAIYDYIIANPMNWEMDEENST